MGHIENSLSELKGFVEGFRVVPQLAIIMLSVVLAAVGLVLAIGIFVLNSMNGQIRDVGAKNCKAWMAGTGPAMTGGAAPVCPN